MLSFFINCFLKFLCIIQIPIIYIDYDQMQVTILILIATSMVITSIVNFAKPAYEDFVGRFAVTINILLSFILWVCSSFAIRPYLEIELATWAVILLWLALGTWATIFYDIWRLVQNLGSSKNDILIELPQEEDGESL